MHVKKLVLSSLSDGSVTLPTPEECKIAPRPGFYFAGWVTWNEILTAGSSPGQVIPAYAPNHKFECNPHHTKIDLSLSNEDLFSKLQRSEFAFDYDVRKDRNS